MDRDLRTSYRPDIDGLRAIAVLAVVGFHVFPSWIEGGFVGVDIFFVISGFLISNILLRGLERGNFSFAHFYARRIKRIFPALILVLAVSLVFGWFVLLTDDYKLLGYHIAAGAAFVSNFVLQLETGYFDNAAELKPLLHLWSLGVEEQFYIIWPVLLFVSFKYRFNSLFLAISIILVSFALNVEGVVSKPAATFYLPHTRLWELLIGGLLAYFRQEKSLRSKYFVGSWASFLPRFTQANNLKAGIGIVLIATSVIGLSKGKAFPGWWALFPTFGTWLVISAGLDAWVNRNLLANRILVFIGLISYPLYLWHWPILAFARIIDPGAPSRETRIAIVLVSIMLAWLTYRLVEQPIRATQTRVIPVILVGALILVALGGYYIHKHDGLSSRLPEIVQRVTSYKNDNRNEYRMGSCLLMPEQDKTSFAKECMDSQPATKGQMVFLWGDSHAAHLYPGLKAYQEQETLRVGQYTASACPPVVDQGFIQRPHCRGINTFVLEKIREEKPDTVVLAASWNIYDLHNLEMARTIKLLREIGIKNIVVVGPVPQWRNGLPRSLGTYLVRNHAKDIPTRIKHGVNYSIWEAESSLKKTLLGTDVIYVSALAVMCNEEGCLVRTESEPDSLMTWDDSHLTKTGSIFLIKQIFQELRR